MERELTVEQKNKLGVDPKDHIYNDVGDGGNYYRPLTGEILRRLQKVNRSEKPTTGN